MRVARDVETPPSNGHGYREFVREAAQAIAACKLNPLACDNSIYHRLAFELVRDASARFAQPRQRVWEDIQELVAARGHQMSGVPGPGSNRKLEGAVFAARFLVAILMCRVIGGHYRRRLERAAQRARAPRAPNGPKFSVVVVSYDRLEYLRHTIDAFHRTIEPANYELIVVDNGSKDRSVEYLRQEAHAGRITKLLLRSRNHGVSGGYNAGFAAADPDASFYVKLDSDICILTPGWASRVAGLFQKDPKIGVVGLFQVDHPGLRVVPAKRLHDVELRNYSNWPCGGCMVISRKLFDDIGFFTEDFDYPYVPDDVDYYARLVRKGYEAYFVRHLQVLHQTYLDRTKYRRYSDRKKSVPYWKICRDLLSQYDRGVLTLEKFYPRYASRHLAYGDIVEIE